MSDPATIDASTGEVITEGGPYTDGGGTVTITTPETSASIVRAAPGDVAEAFKDYQNIQAQLDAALPDCIMEIQGRKFRKKNYWRAVATAFNATVHLVSERRIEETKYFLDEEKTKPDWGYLVTYRATAPNGRCVDGDGSCMASEKGAGQDSMHNVRAHAHTRAKNRAIADLCGFGEVSAEEVPYETHQEGGAGAEHKERAVAPNNADAPITQAQSNLLWAKSNNRAAAIGDSSIDAHCILSEIRARLELESLQKDLKMGQMDEVLQMIDTWQPPAPAASTEDVASGDAPVETPF